MPEQIADDQKPMTGVWYRSTIDPRVKGKVTNAGNGSACLHAGCHPGRCAYGSGLVEVVFTGNGVDRCTVAEFADSWELI
jgi:hypothetical protein